MTSTTRKEIYTFTESVDHSIAFVKNLSQVLQAGRQKCRPFEVEHHKHLRHYRHKSFWQSNKIWKKKWHLLLHLYINYYCKCAILCFVKDVDTGCGMSCISYFYWWLCWKLRMMNSWCFEQNILYNVTAITIFLCVMIQARSTKTVPRLWGRITSWKIWQGGFHNYKRICKSRRLVWTRCEINWIMNKQDTKCEFLTMNDPFLRLGPFLLEHKNKAGNYIAQVTRVDENV